MKIFTSLTDPEVVRLLKNGAVGVIPTDTVYGLVCQAANQGAVERLYGLKDRELKPGTIVAANVEQFAAIGIPKRYMAGAERYWPGAVSVETPHSIAYLHQGTGRQALRIPDDVALRAFLLQVGALQTTSANRPSEPVAETVDEAKAYFGDAVDFYVDGGELRGRPASTIIRIVDDVVEVIREGAVKIDENGAVR